MGVKKIVLADYLSTCDEQGKPIGHTVKVLNEYSEMLCSDYEVWIATAKGTHNNVKNSNKIYTPYSINMGVVSVKDKIGNILKRLKNISIIFKQSKGCPLWICSSDFYIFLYLYIKPKRKEKVVITVYKRNYDGEKFCKIKNAIFNKAVKKTDLIICSDKQMSCMSTPIFHMPDYLYKPEQYERYLSTQKENKVVCLGTMGRNKLLPELIEAFNENGYPLEIIGKFFDADLYKELINNAKDNIKITNDYISSSDYLKILSSAKYSILPYNMEIYKERTSGVILESIFVNTIPIAHVELLDFMRISGIGYKKIQELGKVDFFFFHSDNDYKKFVNDNYSNEKLGRALVEVFEEIF